jgi:hypothetical protein
LGTLERRKGKKEIRSRDGNKYANGLHNTTFPKNGKPHTKKN